MSSFGLMFCALLGTLLLLAPAQGSLSLKPNKEYFYDYSGYALTGRPDSNYFSGFKLKTTLGLFVVKKIRYGFHMQLRFIKTRLDLVDGNISPVQPQNGDSPRLLDKAPSKEIKADFSNILHFNWVYGYVRDVRTSTKDPTWIKNWKKGALNSLSFKLNRVLVKSKKKPTMLVDWKNEVGAEGLCKTGYVSTMRGRKMTLQKIRNLYNCKTSYSVYHSAFLGRTCSKDDSLYGTALRGETRTTFELTKSKSGKYFVDSSRTYGQYALPNPNTKDLVFATFIVQEVKYNMSSNEEPKVKKTKFKADNLLVKTSVRALYSRKKDSAALRKEVLGCLDTIDKSGNDLKLNSAIQSCVSALRLASVNDLKDALKQAKAKGSRVESIVLDTFGVVGTKQAREVIQSMVLDKKTSDARAAALIRMLTFSTLEPTKLEDALMKLASNKRLLDKDRVQTLQTLWMMAGALHCRLERRNDARMAKWLMNQFKADHKNMDEDAKVSTLLMALGNAAAGPSLKDMLTMADKWKKEKKLTLHMRLHGLHALRKYATRPALQSLIRVRLWKIFANPLEDSEIRIAAFQLLLKTNPSRRHFHILMNQLRREPCQHVRTYVISYLQLLAKAGAVSPCRVRLAQLVRWALPTLPGSSRLQPGVGDSRIVFFPIGRSTGIYVSIIYCSHSPLPRAITIGELHAHDQQEIKLWSMTMRSEESGVLLRNMGAPGNNMMERLAKLFKEFKGEKGKSKAAQTTVHYSLSGEDAGYYGTTFLGSKMKPLEAMQKVLKAGRQSAMKSVAFGSGLHTATSLGVVLNFFSGASSVQQFSTKFSSDKKKGVNEAVLTFGASSALDVGLGVSSGTRCAHTLMQFYWQLHPGKPHDLTLTMKMPSKKKMSFSAHVMPHKSPMEAMRFGLKFSQVVNDGKGPAVSKPMQITTDSRETVQELPLMMKMTTTGLTRRGFSRITRDGEMNLNQMLKTGVNQPFETVMARESEFCGFQITCELKKAPTDPKPPKETKIGAKKEKLADVESGKIKKSPRRPYKPPLGLLRLANAEGKLSVSLFKMKNKKRKEVKLFSASVKINSRGDSLEIKAKPRDGKAISVSYTRSIVGALPYYDINNPFTVTANAGSEGKLVIKQGKKTMATLTRTSKISQAWIDEWKELLKNPAAVASTWPDVYRCYTDMKNGYEGSPNCYRAWRELQTFDRVSASVSSSKFGARLQALQEAIASRAGRLYSFIQREKIKKDDGTIVSTVSAEFCPSDARAVSANRNYYCRVLDGLPRWETCVVSYYQKKRQFYVRTFDGLSYTGNLPGPSTKGNSFIIARDRTRGEFTVAGGSDAKGNRFLVAYGKIGDKSCTATVTFKKGKPKMSMKGDACKDNFVKGKMGDVQYLKLKPLGVMGMLTGEKELTLRVSRMMYLNSLHGLCGNLDREPKHMELMGCKKGARKYFSNDQKGWDAMVKSYMTKKPLKFKDCA